MAKFAPKPAELRVRNKGLVRVRVGDPVEQEWNPAGWAESLGRVAPGTTLF